MRRFHGAGRSTGDRALKLRRCPLDPGGPDIAPRTPPKKCFNCTIFWLLLQDSVLNFQVAPLIHTNPLTPSQTATPQAQIAFPLVIFLDVATLNADPPGTLFTGPWIRPCTGSLRGRRRRHQMICQRGNPIVFLPRLYQRQLRFFVRYARGPRRQQLRVQRYSAIPRMQLPYACFALTCRCSHSVVLYLQCRVATHRSGLRAQEGAADMAEPGMTFE